MSGLYSTGNDVVVEFLGGELRMIRHSQSRPRILLLGALLCILAISLSACWNDDEEDMQLVEGDLAEADNSPDLESVSRIDELAELLISAEPDQLRGHRFEVDAWINPAPRANGVSSTPPQGCPIVPEKQDWLSDEPISTQIEVAGVALPNERLGDELAVLRLVVPYDLGFVEVPERARLSGYVLDEEHAGCPGAESLFILEDIIEPLSSEEQADDSVNITDWEQYTHEPTGITLEYPKGWDVEDRDSGQLSRVRFLGPEPFRTIRLEIHDGETYWHPDASEGGTPDVLGGARQEPAMAGEAHAQLIDDDRRTSTGEREARLVFNHDGRTFALAMLFRDGADFDSASMHVFSEMAQRVQLVGDVSMSDPMDPILAASDEIGDGPFLSEADARYVAVNSAGLTAAEAISAELVSERDARNAIDGACRNFDGRPSGVWLVTVEGVTPSGGEEQRLVYLDGTHGNRLCQAEAPGVS
jgi:hypothetical protein